MRIEKAVVSSVPGSTIQAFATDMVSFAKERECVVVGKFNGKKLKADRFTSVDELVNRYMAPSHGGPTL